MKSQKVNFQTFTFLLTKLLLTLLQVKKKYFCTSKERSQYCHKFVDVWALAFFNGKFSAKLECSFYLALKNGHALVLQ